MTENKFQEIHILEQNMQNINAQKQAFSAQLLEVESALSELDKSKESYKLIGNILVKKDSKELKKDLENKKETFEVRIKSFENQEKKLVEKLKSLQKEAMKE